MPIQQAKLPKGSEIVLQQLKSLIRKGEFKPGSKLPSVVELSASFQVGRSTIREALSALKATGWINIRHGGGTFVSDPLPGEGREGDSVPIPDAESLLEILEVRQFIESGCAALAARRRTEADLNALERCLDEMASCLDDEDRSEQADVRFHLALADASHNSIFVDMMASMTRKLQESMRDSRRLWLFAERASTKQLLEEHREIYQAVRSQDEAAASARIMSHNMKVNHMLKSRV